MITEIAATLRGLGRSAAERGLAVRSVGLAVPGIVDEERQTAVHSANLGWRDVPSAAFLEGTSGLPVTLAHDVRAGGVAECRLGAGRGAQDVLFVAVGTGISGAVLRDGLPVRAGGYAGELGHVVVEPDGEACACGGRGCLETAASAAAIAAAYSARTGRQVDGAAAVAAQLSHGDPDARAVWDRAVEALATALATAVTLLAPEVVVLGGGLAEADSRLLDPLRASLARRLTFQRKPELVRAALGDLAGCLGAGISAWHATDNAGTPRRPRTAAVPAS